MHRIGFIITIILFLNIIYCQENEKENDIIIFNETLNESLKNYLIEIVIRYTTLRTHNRWDPATISLISKDYKDTLSSVDQACFKNFSLDKEDYNFVDLILTAIKIC